MINSLKMGAFGFGCYTRYILPTFRIEKEVQWVQRYKNRLFTFFSTFKPTVGEAL